MRPIALRLQAFGSFADAESVDFAALAEAGLFVVGGPTGSGKTTVFDAIAFALYGRAAGDRTTELRSHHASTGTPTEVELVFEVEGARYMVTRRPAQERARRSGKGTRTVELAPTAELREYTSQGWVGIASRPTDVTNRCTELVGLDLHQFQRVVLLPQGDFAEFLLSGTADRQTLLRRLFGTDTYRRAGVWWIDEAKRLAATVTGTDHDIEHHLRSAIADLVAAEVIAAHEIELDDVAHEAIRQALVRGVKTLEPRQAAVLSLRERAIAAREFATRSHSTATVFDDLQCSLVERSRMFVRSNEIEADTSRVEHALAARPVVESALAHTAATELLEVRRAQSDQLFAQLVAGFAELSLDVPVQPPAAIATLATHGHILAGQHELLRHTAHARSEADAAAAAGAAAQRLLAECNERIELESRNLADADASCERLALIAAPLAALVAELERINGTLALADQVLAVESGLAAAQQRYDTARHEFDLATQGFAASIAPRLAQQLVDGEPCAVCGSADHPAPAQPHSGVPWVDVSALDAATEAVQQHAGELSRLLGAVQQARLALAPDTASGAPIESAINQLTERVAVAAKAVELAQSAGDELVTARKRAHQCRERLQLLDVELADANSSVAATAERRRIAAKVVARAEATSAGLVEAVVQRSQSLVVQLQGVAQSWSVAVANTASATEASALTTTRAAEALTHSPFRDQPAASQAALGPERVLDLQREIEHWHRGLAALDTRIATLQPFAPAERPDEHQARADADDAQTTADAEAEAVSGVERYLLDAEASLTAAQRAAAASTDLRARAHTAQLVAQTCSGNVAPRVALETWVLAAELDRVTAQATVHLQRMSKQRYSLQRCDEVGAQANRKSGLDIEVFDAHTGRTRGPQSLSGGERFQASLALALGLADVVSQGGSGSGKVFEALFVDEGFGSLDPEALDDAIEALHHLHQHGRMVGVITHVEAMKQQLPLGFEIRHRPDGNGSTIVQPGVPHVDGQLLAQPPGGVSGARVA